MSSKPPCNGEQSSFGQLGCRWPHPVPPALHPKAVRGFLAKGGSAQRVLQVPGQGCGAGWLRALVTEGPSPSAGTGTAPAEPPQPCAGTGESKSQPKTKGRRKGAGEQGLLTIRNGILITNRSDVVPTGRFLHRRESHGEKRFPLSLFFFFIFFSFSALYILFMPLTNSIFGSWNRNKARFNTPDLFKTPFLCGQLLSPGAQRRLSAVTSP